MVQYITLGSECSPASALKELGKREFALPFDWIVSSIWSIQQCLEEDFSQFHTELYINDTKTRLIDKYGFQYPHDYPLEHMDSTEIKEDSSNHITSSWRDHYQKIHEKYLRRIERFREILKNPDPIIVLSRYCTVDIIHLQRLFLRLYNRTLYIVNSHNEVFETDTIYNVFTEKNGIWNETELWSNAIERMLTHTIG